MSAAPALWTKHRSIADGIARDYFIEGAERDDVHQEARIALWEACRCYDSTKGPFTAFARLVIHRHLQESVKMARRLKHGPLNGAAGNEVLAFQSGGREPFEVLWEKEELARIRRGAKALTERQAQALADLLNDRWSRPIDNALQLARQKLRAAA